MNRQDIEDLGLKLNLLPYDRDIVMFRHKGKRQITRITPREENGYLYICFSHNGKRYKLKAARVVYALYYGNCPDNMNVAYKDGNKLNIVPSNLELITVSERFNRTWERRKK